MSNSQLEFGDHGEQEDDLEESDSDSFPLSSLDPSLSSTLNSLCLEHRRLGAEIDERVKTQKSLKESIEDLILSLPAKRIQAPGWRTVKSQKTTYPLQKTLLVKESNSRGIDPIDVIAIIKAASPAKPGKEYVSILAPGSGKEETKTNNQNAFD